MFKGSIVWVKGFIKPYQLNKTLYLVLLSNSILLILISLSEPGHYQNETNTLRMLGND